MTDAEKIAASLSDAQRRALIDVDHSTNLYVNVVLIGRGLLDYRPRWLVFGEKVLVRTMRGNAVRRAIIQGETA